MFIPEPLRSILLWLERRQERSAPAPAEPIKTAPQLQDLLRSMIPTDCVFTRNDKMNLRFWINPKQAGMCWSVYPVNGINQATFGSSDNFLLAIFVANDAADRMKAVKQQ